MTLAFAGDGTPEILCREDSETVHWRVAVGSLVVVAEYTTPNGPYLDDYFLVLGYREQGQLLFREVPLDMTGTVLDDLSAATGWDLAFELARSTTWNSRVMWPPELKDKPLFEYSTVKTNAIVRWLAGDRCHAEFSAEVAAYLAMRRPPRS